MRATLLVVPSLAMLGACDRISPPPEPAARPAIDLTLDIPQDGAAQVVRLVTREIPKDGEIPWHTHPGIELAYVERGKVELTIDGRPAQVLKSGDHFVVPRGAVHSGRNIGPRSARLVLTYVVDKDAPLRSPADAPKQPKTGG